MLTIIVRYEELSPNHVMHRPDGSNFTSVPVFKEVVRRTPRLSLKSCTQWQIRVDPRTLCNDVDDIRASRLLLHIKVCGCEPPVCVRVLTTWKAWQDRCSEALPLTPSPYCSIGATCATLWSRH
jgi:hypothetical protein